MTACVNRRATVPREPRPFSFELRPDEIAELRHPVGAGGYQNLQQRILEQLDSGSTVTLNDQQLGELLRYMTQYQGGGFQGHLRAAFSRSLKEQLGL
jgi:hypothetical protein